ncbi:uncharacterized protein LOC144827827 [Lissotriton helveticus]
MPVSKKDKAIVGAGSIDKKMVNKINNDRRASLGRGNLSDQDQFMEDPSPPEVLAETDIVTDIGPEVANTVEALIHRAPDIEVLDKTPSDSEEEVVPAHIHTRPVRTCRKQQNKRGEDVQRTQEGDQAQRLHHPTPYSPSTMRAILAAVVMVQALITGDCLLCEQCFALHNSSCSGIMTQCPPDVTHCVAGLENNTVGSDVILTAFKDCLDPSQKAACDREFSMNTAVLSFRISRTCCDSDFCNGGDLQVPPSDNTPNGYICEDCFNDQSTDPCTATGVVQCTGKQNTCVRISGTISRPGEAARSYSGKGCSTQDFCKLGVFNIAGTQAYDYGFKCSLALKV